MEHNLSPARNRIYKLLGIVCVITHWLPIILKNFIKFITNSSQNISKLEKKNVVTLLKAFAEPLKYPA